MGVGFAEHTASQFRRPGAECVEHGGELPRPAAVAFVGRAMSEPSGSPNSVDPASPQPTQIAHTTQLSTRYTILFSLFQARRLYNRYELRGISESRILCSFSYGESTVRRAMIVCGFVLAAFVGQNNRCPAAQPAAPRPANASNLPKPDQQVVISRQRVFAIPFQLETSRDPTWKPIEAQLYVSTDAGQHWRLYAKAPASQKRFTVRTGSDGEYWFAIRTADQSGQLRPRTINGPGLRVLVDTKSPAPPQRNPPSQQVASRPPRPESPRVSPKASKTPMPNGELPDSELTPKNSVSVSISPSVGGKYLPPSGPTDDGRSLPGMPAGQRPQFVRDLTFDLEYDTRWVESQGVGRVELFGTMDAGRTWRSFGVDADRRSPVRVRVKDDGVYGFRFVILNRAGKGPRPPQNGDQPDLWVCVDRARPSVQITSTRRGSGFDANQMTISWRAEDAMLLLPRPISLSYGANRGGPWITIVGGIENTGNYAWTPDDRVPEAVYLRVEARDEAGNIGEYVTPEPVAIVRTASGNSSNAPSNVSSNASSSGVYRVPAAAKSPASSGPRFEPPTPKSEPSEQSDGPSLGQP